MVLRYSMSLSLSLSLIAKVWRLDVTTMMAFSVTWLLR